MQAVSQKRQHFSIKEQSGRTCAVKATEDCACVDEEWLARGYAMIASKFIIEQDTNQIV